MYTLLPKGPPLSRDQRRALIATSNTLELRLAQLPRVDKWLPREWKARQDAVDRLIADLRTDHGARIDGSFTRPASITLLDIHATSDGGMEPALRNWIAAARRKAGVK